jgi:prepilin-type processing-associated H-X9-DG protein
MAAGKPPEGVTETGDGSDDATWRCARCGTRNPRDVSQCLHCGEPAAPAGGGREISKPTRVLLWVAFVSVGLLVAQYWFVKTVELGPQRARREVCRYSMSKLLGSLEQYTAEAGGYFPPAHRWNQALSPVLRSQGVDLEHGVGCPNYHFEWLDDEFKESRSASYAFNRYVGELSPWAFTSPERTVVIFETDSGNGWDAAGGPELLPDEPRHLGGDNYGFADGHVQWIKRKRLPDGTWAKAPDAEVSWEVR